MADYKAFYRTDKQPENVTDEQLLQLLRIVWDGDLISKPARDDLFRRELISRSEGFQVITPLGISYCIELGYIHS